MKRNGAGFRDEAVLALARDLIGRPSVTPEDAGCQDLLAARLTAAGFTVHRLDRGSVRNLWATHGEGRPTLALVGHSDVVPAGTREAWRSDPFEAVERDGQLIGRGAADMKGSLAAMVVALERFVNACPDHRGTVGLMVTSDEEGDAVDGIRHVADTLAARGDAPDWALVGEPTSEQRFGDTCKTGRRGSLTGRLRIAGRAGHVAYPQLADNPVHRIGPVIEALIDPLDEGTPPFPPSSLQVIAAEAGTGTTNVIPGQAELLFNVRFNPRWTAESLQTELLGRLRRALGRDPDLDWTLSGLPFETRDPQLTAALERAVISVCGNAPRHSTAGGTSDGRFLAPHGTAVVEFGPCNATIHQPNESVGIDELGAMAAVTEQLLRNLLT